jgi:hypothetical protein
MGEKKVVRNHEGIPVEKVFKMPPAQLGDIVMFFPMADRPSGTQNTGHVAIVTAIGIDSLNLNVLAPNNHNLMIRDGVRHMDDPKCQHPELRMQGGWDYTPQHVRMERYFQLVGELAGELGVRSRDAVKEVAPV